MNIFDLRITARDFPSNIQIPSTLKVTWADFIWSFITVGRDFNDIIKHKKYSLYYFLNKVFFVYTYFQINNNKLSRSKIYNESDPSEKSGYSYYTGLALAKYISNEIFDIPQLLHLDTYKRNFLINYNDPNSKSRPDLIGITTSGEYGVFESKGRTKNFSPKASESAKMQTEQINRINNKVPMRIGIQSFFNKDALCLDMVDPDKASEDSIDYNFKLENFIDLYYEPFIKIIEFNKEIGIKKISYEGADYNVIPLKEFDIEIGLLSSLEDRIKSKRSYEDIKKELRPFEKQYNNDYIIKLEEKVYEKSKDPFLKIGSDGIYVKLGETWKNKK